MRRVEALLKLPRREGIKEYRILRPWSHRGYARPQASQFVLETEPRYGAQAVVTKLEDEWRTARPPHGSGAALLYLPHISCDQELREDERLRELQAVHPAFFAGDYRHHHQRPERSVGRLVHGLVRIRIFSRQAAKIAKESLTRGGR